MNDNVKMFDCAGCGKETIAMSSFHYFKDGRLPPGYRAEGGRIFGRPYCVNCLEVRQPPNRPATRDPEGGPWQENVVRELEDG